MQPRESFQIRSTFLWAKRQILYLNCTLPVITEFCTTRSWYSPGNVKYSTTAMLKMIADVVNHPMPQHKIRRSRFGKFLGSPQLHIDVLASLSSNRKDDPQ